MDGFLTKTMEDLFRGKPPKEFQPCAYYDKHLDCIRVQIKDCSFTEIRLSPRYTIYQANHVNEGQYMGFSMKGIRHLFEKHNLPKDYPYKLAEIIDEIVKDDPTSWCDLIQMKFAENLNLEVEDIQELKAA